MRLFAKTNSRKLYFMATLLLFVIFSSTFLTLFFVRQSLEPVNKKQERVGVFTQNAKKCKSPVLIIPHHDLVAEARQKFIKKLLSDCNAENIVVLSPNHLSLGSGNLQSSKRLWSLSSGNLEPAKELIEVLKKANVNVESDTLIFEHGIYNIARDIKENLPKAKIIPVTIKRNTPKRELDKFLEVLNTACKNCVILASVDMSHYLPEILAKAHDDFLIRKMCHVDADAILKRADADSPEALYIAMSWAKMHGYEKFNLYYRGSSNSLTKSKDYKLNTSYIMAYYTKGKGLCSKAVSLSLAGDFMFSRAVFRLYGNEPELVFKNLSRHFFLGSDAFILNFEGALLDKNKIEWEKIKGLTFLFPRKTAKLLSKFGISHVSLANNHSFNNGHKGLTYTRDTLKLYDIETFGDPFDSDDLNFVSFVKGDGIDVALIGVSALYSDPGIDELIRKFSENERYRVLVVPHWGTEYARKHNEFQERLAHKWIDLGADMVIGAHPHVVQDFEIYKGAPIFYSLGNFVFDQSEKLLNIKGVQNALNVSVEFGESYIKLIVLPIYLENYVPKIDVGGKKILKDIFEGVSDALETDYGYMLILKYYEKY